MNSARSTAKKQLKKQALRLLEVEQENTQLRQCCHELTQANEQLLQRCDQLVQAYDHLLFQFKQFQRHRFGQRSEAYIDPDNPQGLLFDEASEKPLAKDNDEDDENDGIKVKGHVRKNKRNKGFAGHLPRKEIWIKVPEHLRTCSCGCEKQALSPARHERLHYEPPVFEVHVELREQLVCPNGCQGQWAIAEKPKRVLPKARFTESLLAHIIVSKLIDRQPYYHLEKQFVSRAGFSLSRQSMARNVIDSAGSIQPLYNLMKDGHIEYDVGALDATTLQVLREPDRPPTRKSYCYCFMGGSPGTESVLFKYNAHDHKLFVNDWYAGFRGTLHCDADPFFELLFESNDVDPSYCHSHARRKFEPIAKATKTGLAHQAMRYFNRLFAIERQATKDELSPSQRLAYRQQHSKPIMDNLKAWLDRYYPSVLPKSPLGKAMEYCLKYWLGLCAFLGDGRLRLDNNLTEQQIKQFVVARKNFLFCTSVKGAQALALHFSLLATAQVHQLDPYRYYVAILKAIPHCTTVEDYEALLPWNIDLPKVGQVKQAA